MHARRGASVGDYHGAEHSRQREHRAADDPARHCEAARHGRADEHGYRAGHDARHWVHRGILTPEGGRIGIMSRLPANGVLGACLLLAATFQAAAADLPTAPDAFRATTSSEMSRPVQYDQPEWHPIGCVEVPQECEHLADARGYHHHRVVRDHHACPYEPHLLCIAAG